MQVLNTETPNLNDKIDQFNGSIFLNADRQVQKISLDSIEYIKGYGDYMQVNCTDKTLSVHIKMKSLEESLPSDDFFRIHKSYIIRLDKVEKVTTHYVQIGQTHIPMSRGARKELLELLPWIQ